MLRTQRWLHPVSAADAGVLSSSSSILLLSQPSKSIFFAPHHHNNHRPATATLTLKKTPPPCFALTTQQEEKSQQNADYDSSNNGEGPVELPFSVTSLFATSDEPAPLQTATSVLLTGAITVFLFRSLRRRAKRAKEMKLRSSGSKKSLKEEAVESLKAVSLSAVSAKKTPPSPVQAFLGALTAGVIALILYKFTTTIESALNRQTISDNYSVRQITITIRTIINGLCYLATFVFGANALGLFLYSGQLALNSLTRDSPIEGEKSPNLKSEVDVTSTQVNEESDDQSPENTQ